MQLSRNEKLTFEIDCKECDEGKLEVGPICNRPASNCCGGCFETHQCDTCEGSGTLYVKLDHDDLQDLVLELWNDSAGTSELILSNII